MLVRLRTRSNSINALRKAGNEQVAKRIEDAQAERNRSIVQAFKQEFDFCPVYFFFSDDSKNVRDHKLSEVRFLNDQLQHDPSIQFAGKNYLTAEFANIEQDTLKRFNNYATDPADSKEKRYYGGTNFGFAALIIKSDQLVQLRRPFPYYVRTYEGLPFKRKKATVVKILNKELHQFYQ